MKCIQETIEELDDKTCVKKNGNLVSKTIREQAPCDRDHQFYPPWSSFSATVIIIFSKYTDNTRKNITYPVKTLQIFILMNLSIDMTINRQVTGNCSKIISIWYKSMMVSDVYKIYNVKLYCKTNNIKIIFSEPSVQKLPNRYVKHTSLPPSGTVNTFH